MVVRVEVLVIHLVRAGKPLEQAQAGKVLGAVVLQADKAPQAVAVVLAQ